MTSPHWKQRFMNGLKNKEKEDKESKHSTVTESLEFTSPPKGKRRRMNLMERFELNETILIPLPSISPSSSSVSFIPPRFYRSLSTPSSSSLSLQEPSLVLPTITSSRHPDLHVITPQTVVHLLSGVYKNQEYKIIDCRFPYEYKGGHLSHAISIVTPMEIKELLIPPKKENTQTMVLIFYCEFSMSRAPAMVRYLRQLDRQLHFDCYPTLYYPQLYLIEGGYKHCFESYQKELCTTPPVYIRMKDQTFKEEYKIQIKGHRQYWKRSISEY